MEQNKTVVAAAEVWVSGLKWKVEIEILDGDEWKPASQFSFPLTDADNHAAAAQRAFDKTGRNLGATGFVNSGAKEIDGMQRFHFTV